MGGAFCLPVEFAGRAFCVPMPFIWKTCQLTTDNNAMRSTYGRAGFKPRRKRRRLRPSTACAALPAQLLPFDVDPKRETDNPLTVSNRQLETIRNRHNPFTINQMTFSSRPKISARCGRPSEMWRSGTARQVKGSLPAVALAKAGRRDASATLGEGKPPNSNRPY
jgi:hypothetical protein